jgi:hypothetical protein
VRVVVGEGVAVEVVMGYCWCLRRGAVMQR